MVDQTQEDPLTLRALLQYFPRRQALERSVIALPDYGAVYVKNPKAGCSTMTLWLNRVHTGDRDFLPARVHEESRLPKPRAVGWDTVLRMLDGDAVRFTFVRDPRARVRSTWFAKVHLQPTYRAELQTLLGMPVDPGTPLTFEQFLTAIEQQDPLTEMDRHWRPQHVNLLHPLVEYDLIGRLESFDADLARLREMVGFPDVPVTVPNSHKAGQPDVYDGRPDLLRRVEDLYARDLELYGY